MHNLTPIGFVAPEVNPVAKRPISEAKKRANKANAQKSTGPTTAKGKAISSQNAVKHGLCRESDLLTDVAPEVVEARMEAWDRELNPRGSLVAGFMVGLAVRSSFRLETCDRVYHAKVAKLGREAKENRKAERMSDVERYSRMIMSDCDTAVRNLRATPEGCEFLIQCFETMRLTISKETPFFDAHDEKRFLQLKGQHNVIQDKAPCPLYHCTARMIEYREVAAKLKLNERPDAISWSDRYLSRELHQEAKDSLPILHKKMCEAADELSWIIDREVAWLKARRDELIAIDEQDIDESAFRSRFDSSDDGKLLRRYESEHERDIHRNLKGIRELGKQVSVLTQADVKETVTSNPATQPAPAVPATPPRNEATVRPDSGPIRVSSPPRNEVKTGNRPRKGRGVRKSNPRK